MTIYLAGAPSSCADCTYIQVHRAHRQVKTQYHCARFRTPCKTALEACNYVPLLEASNEQFYADGGAYAPGR